MQPADILNLTVPNKSGVAVPLSTIATVSWVNGMEQSVRFNGYPAMELSGSPVNGVSSGQAMAAVQQMVDDMGGGYSLEWGGQSREEAKGGSQTVVLYALAAAAVFLVLAALYESWSIPLAVSFLNVSATSTLGCSYWGIMVQADNAKAAATEVKVVFNVVFIKKSRCRLKTGGFQTVFCLILFIVRTGYTRF